MATFKQNMREIFSEGETGKLSSKRIIGTIAMFIAIAATVFLVIRDGSNEIVEDLLMTILIMSASLLGLPAIAGAWGKSKIGIGQPLPNNNYQENNSYEDNQNDFGNNSSHSQNIPNCDNCYYKQNYQNNKRNRN